MAREITTHHDGFGLTESIKIFADEAGPGGASHLYVLTMGDQEVGRIQFQKGPRDVKGSTPGIVESALLAIVKDRMDAFNAGDYRCRENSLIATHAEEAMNWLWRRAMGRKQRGVLGTYNK